MKNETPGAAAPSCADEFEPQTLSVAEAQQRILESVEPVHGIEKVALRQALNRVLAEEAVSPIDVPSHTNSAMDGFALKGAELPGQASRAFRLVGAALAGHPFHGSVGPGECVRIMTGAPVPDGADTVVMQEHVHLRGDDQVEVDARNQPGQNVRQAGEDIRRGDVAVPAGRRLGAAELGMLASLGLGEVKLRRKVRAAFFSTGDELRSIGESLAEGEIYDSNRYTLHGMLTGLGIEPIDMGVVPDQREATLRALREAASMADVILTSGGVSVGEADFVKPALAELGEMHFWKVSMKPGRPLTFGRIGDALFFGLPGNPVSVMVTFYIFVQPALHRLAGREATQPLLVQARCATGMRKRPGRTEYQRGTLRSDPNGDLVVSGTGPQGSGILRSVSEANCFVILPLESGSVEPGTLVTVMPFYGLL
ncbi:MAG: bifunctional molybdopterin-guanine dinucleotide biosynthesis adaptor protein MobB/molybdopterin molybdotransferase MoeA [Gammaproteobacteria bacterium]|nr:bifunctional molybdopterin-guanine dinucleotide biosynthesis adaptor protein MobB/molybdopterin molybdotransferase MoeA [Gammaproteobacteria bacterium]